MTQGAQKFISRNRAPRVQIEYDVELYGSQKKVQLPFVMGVMSDLAGKSHLAQPSIEKREFLEIDVDNFDDRMRGMQPRTAFSVPNTLTGEGQLEIDLTFEKLDDFSPQAIAEKVAPLRTLLEARNQLAHLMTYMDGKTRAEALIEEILANPALLKSLAGTDAKDDAEANAALETLRSVSAKEPAAPDPTADVLGALKAAQPPEANVEPDADDILAGLSSQPAPETKPQETAADVLASLRFEQPAKQKEDTNTADTLADLAAKALPDQPESGSVAQTLRALAQSEAPSEEPDNSSAVLDSLASLDPAPSEKDDDDALQTALASLESDLPDDVADIDLDDLLASDDDLSLGGGETTSETESEQGVAVSDVLPLEDAADEIDGLGDLDDLLGDLADTDTSAPSAEQDDPSLSSPAEHSDRSEDLASEPVNTGASDLDIEALDDLLDPETEQPEAPTDSAEDLLDGLLDEVAPASDETVPQAEADTNKTPEPEFTFGTMSIERPDPARLERKRFRIALMGDFSGRSARGLVEIGDALANRTPILLDPDTVEEVIKGFGTTLVLPIGKDGAGVEVRLDELDDLHPDELYEKSSILYELRNLKSQLASGATVANATEKLKAWGKAYDTAVAPPKLRSGGNAVPANLKLTEFQKLIGDTGNQLTDASPIEDMIARIVGPYVQSAPGDDTQALLDAVDNALSAAMRLILHHPEFQSIEAQWRSLDLIARRIETDDQLEVMLYDVSAEEIAADLAAADDLSGSGLARMLTEAPMDPETGRGGYSAVFGLYTFEETPPHADLLGRVARVAAHIDAPFIAAMSSAFMDTAKEDRHPLVASAWDSLRAMPESVYLGLVAPRFLLRRPYGPKSEPIYEFDFEEFSMSEGLRGMLWANPVILPMILMAKSFRENGAHLGLGTVMQMGDMPYHFVTDTYGDQIALPCTERNLTLDRVEKVMARGVMPVVSIKGRDEIRLASFQSLAGGDIRGPWTGTPPPEPSPAQPVSAPATPEQPADDDDLGLDDLLAGFDDATPDSPADDLDADLAALLEDL